MLERYEAAEPLLRRALAIRESALGADHSETACTRGFLATLLRRAGREAEAQALEERAKRKQEP
jgi:hypothetical protein